jgi:tetratricopeptide (TPR) repeat protein
MEALIVLVILSALGYIIYSSLAATRFKKGLRLLKAESLSEAAEIFTSLIPRHIDAPGKLANVKWKMACKELQRDEKKAVKIFEEVLAIRKKLSANSNLSLYEPYEAKASLNLFQIQLKEISATGPSLEKIIKLEKCLADATKAKKTKSKKEFSSLFFKIKSNIADSQFQIGLRKEKGNDFPTAIFHYEQVIKPVAVVTPKLKSEAYARIGICKLKSDTYLSPEISTHVGQAGAEVRRDFFYRYATFLIRENKLDSADQIIHKHLNHRSSAFDKLRSLIAAIKLRRAIKAVEEINSSLDHLYESGFQIQGVDKLYKMLELNTPDIAAAIPECQDRLQELKPSLFNRLLSHYISEESYGKAIGLIENYPSFWEDPDLLKNLGICSLHLLAKGEMVESNYKTVISSWLTAIYADAVLLKSLDDTSWDDPYTFTLADSIGSVFMLHAELPENVNYELVSETNLSIGATQRELLGQFEAVLNQQNYPESFLSKIHAFYSMEKKAIEKVVAVIAKEIVFAAPYFAFKHGICSIILEDLEEDYETYQDENSLEAGVPYSSDKTQNVIGQFADAKAVINDVVKAIESMDIDLLKTYKTESYKALIRKFENTRSAAEDRIFNCIATKIERSGENEKMISIMELAIQISPGISKLQYQYANFVCGYCISKVNAKKISNFDALVLMNNAYLQAMENPRVCQNLIILIRFNLMDIVNGGTRFTQKIYDILDEIHKYRSLTFKRCSHELSDTRKSIMKDLKNAGVDISLLLPRGDIFSELLSGKSLTVEGYTLKKVLGYFDKLSSN